MNAYYSLATWGFAAKPGHPVVQGHLEFFKNTFMRNLEERPFYYNKCFSQSAGSVLFNTGPPYFGMIYFKH